MLSSVEQAFVGRDEKQALLKAPAWEATPHGEGPKGVRLIGFTVLVTHIAFFYLNSRLVCIINSFNFIKPSCSFHPAD